MTAPTKLTWPALLLVAALSALLGASLSAAWLRAPRASAQGQQRYEYKVLTLEFSQYRNQEEWKAVLQANNNDEWLAVGPFHEAILNSWAGEGWELEQLVERRRGSTLIYLRRPKR